MPPKQNKSPRSMRLSPIAELLIESEIEERKKKLPKDAKVTRTDIIEEALLRLAAQKPELRDKIIESLGSDPRFAAVKDFLLSNKKENA